MNRNTSSVVVLGVLAVAVVALIVWNSSVNKDAERIKTELALLQRTVDSLKAQAPGLGDYMSTIQLHTAKLWFAGHASNWKLVEYEVHELNETMAAAETLHAQKNNVDVSNVLLGIRTALSPLFEQSVAKKSLPAFGDAYHQLLVACNGCHRPAGYEFIQIITPTREPVTNQQWKESNR